MKHDKNTIFTAEGLNDFGVVCDSSHKRVFGEDAYDKFAAERKRLKRRGKTLLLLRWKDGRTEQWVGAAEGGKYSAQEMVNLFFAFDAIRRGKLMEAQP